MRSAMTLWTVLAMTISIGLAGCLGDGTGQELDTYVVGDTGVPDLFILSPTDDGQNADLFAAFGMDENPGEMTADVYGGNQTGAKQAYGAVMSHESNDTRLILWSAVRFANATAAEDFLQSIEQNQACPSFEGALRDQDVVAIVQVSSQDNDTLAAADTIVNDLETDLRMQPAC